jgi:hypothetical protein
MRTLLVRLPRKQIRRKAWRSSRQVQIIAKRGLDGGISMTGARAFVAVVYAALGASFLASSGILIKEFYDVDWLSMLVAHSHLFLFFSVFGILSLAAFYIPSVVFTHLYWTHLPYGRLRFLAGLVVVAASSFGVAWWLNAKPRAIWEASPEALAADRGETVRCGAAGSCRRAPILDAVAGLRREAQRRVGLSKFARSCKVDPLLDPPEEMTRQRWCFPAEHLLDGYACCDVQARFAAAVARLQEDPQRRSLSASLDVVFMPLKIFFVLIVVVIGGLLAVWRHKLDAYYSDLVPDIERGIIIGAIAMLFWPLMDYAYQQTANALFGRWISGTQVRLSLVIAPWALLLLFYFLRHLGAYSAIVGQISGVVVAAVYVLRYESLNDWAVRLLGTGMDIWTMAALIGIALAGLVCLIWPRRSRASTPSYGASNT